VVLLVQIQDIDNLGVQAMQAGLHSQKGIPAGQAAPVRTRQRGISQFCC
jgi:hypothetical protein